MSEQQQLDPVVQLQDLRERLYRGEEIAPAEYEVVLTSLRQHRRAGGRAVKAEKKSKGSSTIEKVDLERMDSVMESF